MTVRRPLQFDHDDRRRVYEYVERKGTARRNELASALDLDESAICHHIAILKRDGRIAVEDDLIRIAFEPDDGETHVSPAGTSYRIRVAREEDLAGIVGVITSVVSAGAYVEAENVAQLVDHEEVLLRFNEIESRMFFVATVDEEVVGWVHLRGSELEKLSHTTTLTVGVLAEYRGQGIGSALLRRGLEWAGENGYERIYQSVPATNQRAIDFLEHHGWTVEAVRQAHYRIDGTAVDEVMLATEVVPAV